ncbi:MAG: GntR family transcriptional regulator [Dehalobacterium sp.]
MEEYKDFNQILKNNEFMPMREVIFHFLRESIISGKFAPDDHLIEEELAKQLNVSRTPIREAIRKLELEGLVRRSPRRGVVVRKFSLEDAEEIYDLRSVLEGYAARLATKNISMDQINKLKSLLSEMKESIKNGNTIGEMDLHKKWHLTLYAASKNSRLERLLNDYADYLQFFRTLALQNPGRLNETTEQHESLIHAIESGDSELAEKVAREHVVRGKEAFLRQWPGTKAENTKKFRCLEKR